MSKFMQGLVLVILIGFAAQIVLSAVGPLLPFAVIGLIISAVAIRWFKGKGRRW